MADQPYVEPDPHTSLSHEEGMEALQKIKDKAVYFVPRKCPTCGYTQEMKYQEFCADCLEKTQQKIPLA